MADITLLSICNSLYLFEDFGIILLINRQTALCIGKPLFCDGKGYLLQNDMLFFSKREPQR